MSTTVTEEKPPAITLQSADGSASRGMDLSDYASAPAQQPTTYDAAPAASPSQPTTASHGIDTSGYGSQQPASPPLQAYDGTPAQPQQEGVIDHGISSQQASQPAEEMHPDLKSPPPDYPATQNPMQYAAPAQGQQQQQQGVQTGPTTAWYNLREAPAYTQCPRCHRTAMTRTSKEMGNTAVGCAVALCCFTGLLCAWIPFVTDSLKDTQHSCGACGNMLLTFTNGGKVKPAPGLQLPAASPQQPISGPKAAAGPQQLSTFEKPVVPEANT